jgi:hypothetical protein
VKSNAVGLYEIHLKFVTDFVEDFCPISISSARSKAQEKIMMDQIVAFCEKRSLVNCFQSDFRSGHSTTTVLLKVTDAVAKDLERNLRSCSS